MTILMTILMTIVLTRMRPILTMPTVVTGQIQKTDGYMGRDMLSTVKRCRIIIKVDSWTPMLIQAVIHQKVMCQKKTVKTKKLTVTPFVTYQSLDYKKYAMNSSGPKKIPTK